MRIKPPPQNFDLGAHNLTKGRIDMKTQYDKVLRSTPWVDWNHIRESQNVIYTATRTLGDGKEYVTSLTYAEDTAENFDDFKNWVDQPFRRRQDVIDA